jgi:hypothetical protein
VYFNLIDSLSLPGDQARPNEDAFAHMPHMAVVFDGATGLGERLMPGRSDAQWLAQFAVRRLRAHAQDAGPDPREWLRLAVHDAQKSFAALRHREPQENYEIPFGSLMLGAIGEGALDLLWFGDCGALIQTRESGFMMVGDTRAARTRESARAGLASKAPAAAGVRDEFLPALRASRNTINTPGGDWLFAPDQACASHAQEARVAVEEGGVLLIASDGFLAISVDYGRYTPEALLETAKLHGLAALGEELRTIEAADPEGRAFPRFKRSDDATALLLSLGPQKG